MNQCSERFPKINKSKSIMGPARSLINWGSKGRVNGVPVRGKGAGGGEGVGGERGGGGGSGEGGRV